MGVLGPECMTCFLQDLFRDDLGTHLIEIRCSSASIDLVLEMPSLRAMAELGIPDLFESPRKFAVEFARAFIGLIARRQIKETLLVGEREREKQQS